MGLACDDSGLTMGRISSSFWSNPKEGRPSKKAWLNYRSGFLLPVGIKLLQLGKSGKVTHSIKKHFAN